MMTDTEDARFDEAEADVARGEPWRFREDDSPNPLTLKVTGWANGHTKHGDAEFLNGVDRTGKPWSVLVGAIVLKKRLIDGLVEEWSDDDGKYVVTDTLGRTQVGEVVSLKYLGDGESASTGNPYPKFSVVRLPVATPSPEKPNEKADKEAGDGDIPF